MWRVKGKGLEMIALIVMSSVLFAVAVTMITGITIAATAYRDMPERVEPGEEFDVSISVSDYGSFGKVVETLPDGFSHVSSTLPDEQVRVTDGKIEFVLFGEDSFTYTVKATTVEGSYSFSGILLDEYKNEWTIGGDSVIIVEKQAPSKPFVIYGYVFYADGTACNGPIVRITNLNTSKTWEANTTQDSNYYELNITTDDIRAGDVLQFNASSPDEKQKNTTEYTVTQEDINAGGIFNFNITLPIEKVHNINITTDYKGACNGIKITRDGTDVVGCEENLGIGGVYKIRYKLVNEGDFNETVNMTITVYNETFSETIGTPTHSLKAGDSDRYYVEWDTEGLAPGTYTIKVEASIPDDADPTDNIRTRDVILFADTEGPVIEFIEPTPPDGANLTVNYVNVTVRVTDESGVGTVLLNWNGENETMYAITPEIYSVNKTGLTAGTYTFKVYANDTLNNWNVSETRSVIVSVPQKKIGDMNGDGEVTFDDVIALAKHVYFGDPVYDDPDVNGDDEVTFDDVILLAKHIYFGTPIYP